MKNLIYIFAILFTISFFTACEAEELNNDETELATGHGEVGDPEEEDPQEDGL